MSNRILDYPEATAITSDDYILLDNAGTGAKCIKASALNVNMDNYTIKEARGSIASFDDGEDLPLAFMGAYITAIQDLHGYDYPWVGGSGLNLFHMNSSISQTSAGVVYTSDDNYMILNNTKSGGSTANFNNTTITLPSGTYYAKAFAISGTASKVNQSFNLKDNGASVVAFDLSTVGTFTLSEEKTLYLSTTIWEDGITYNNYKIGIVVSKTSSIDKFYPYSNECPIIGFSGVEVVRDGIQQWDEEWEVGDIDAQGNPTSSTTLIRTKNFNPCKPNTTYSVVIPSGKSMYVKYYDKDKNFITPTVSASSTITTPSNCYYFKFVMGSAYGTTYNNDIAINYPSTDTSYHAYNGNTYSLTFTDGSNPLTVYYGTVDLISGLLTVTYGRDLGSSLNWGDYGSNNTYYAEISSKKAGFENLLMSDYSYFSGTYANMPNGTFKGSGNTKYIYIRDDRYSSATEFKNNITTSIVYELATPLTYQLSKQQIRSLVGVNNIFADTGDSIVDYRKLWVKPEM